jgi:hypothetical protein
MKFRKILILLFVAILAGSAVGQARNPKTPREFFWLMPQEYFILEGLKDRYSKEDLARERKEYLESFLEIEDTKNGFMQCGGDGSQERFKMALFKKPDATYIVGLYVFGEWGEKYYFLEYRDRKWKNVSLTMVPGYRRSYIYQMPRYGTTIRVFERKNFSAEYDFGEKGRKLYDLVWKSGKFRIRH